MFIFKDKRQIADVPEEGEFVRYLSTKDISFNRLDMYGGLEIGTMLSYFQNELNKPKCRPFNKMEFKGDIVLKYGINEQGHKLAQDEIAWYKKVVDKKWAKSHWNTIKQFYRRAPYFKEYADIFEKLYNECEQEEYLCKINYKFIYAINEILGIKTKISFSQDYGLIEGKTERLVDLVQKAGGTEYLSGPAAKDYIKAEFFEKANIKLSWMDYSEYPEYPQLCIPFEHGVSVLDLIFNCGPESRKFMKA